MNSALTLGFAFGVAFLLLLFATAIYLIISGKPVDVAALFLLRTILALAGAGAAGFLAGFLDVQIGLPAVTIQAGGALAVFALIYKVNPPNLIQNRIIKPEKARKIKQPGKARTTSDLPESEI